MVLIKATGFNLEHLNGVLSFSFYCQVTKGTYNQTVLTITLLAQMALIILLQMLKGKL